MIVPSRWLIVAVAVGIVPLLTVARMYPRLSAGCGLAVLIFVAIAVVDAWEASRALKGYRAIGPPTMRLARNAQAEMVLELVREQGGTGPLRLYLNLPDGMSSDQSVQRKEAAGVFRAVFIPHRRGTFKITRCDVESRSRAGFWSARRALALRTEVHVYPDLRGDRTAAGLLSRSGTGLRSLRQVGKGRDFERLRDYAAGDPFEEISWKATARHGRPIVRVFQVEKTQEIYILLDVSRLSARDDAIEEFVKAALLLALAAEREGDRYGLVIFSDRVHYFLRAARGKVHYAAFRDLLQRVQTQRVTADLSELFTFLQLQVRKRSLLCFLTALDDPLLAETFARDLRIVMRKHVAIVAVMDRAAVQPVFNGPPPARNSEVYAGLAGHLVWTQREETRKNLERYGVQFAAVDPRRAGAQLVALYSRTKLRQLL